MAMHEAVLRRVQGKSCRMDGSVSSQQTFPPLWVCW